MNKENLLKLATYLLSGELKAEFDMHVFDDTISSICIKKENCGTVGCAAGHGPYAGIFKPAEEGWVSYTGRCFIETYTPEQETCWGWCFSAGWADFDNTPQGAAKRILYLLKHEAPPVEFKNIGLVLYTFEETQHFYQDLTLQNYLD